MNARRILSCVLAVLLACFSIVPGGCAARGEASGADSSGADTSGADSSGADTSGADSSGAETYGADTSGVDASGADSSGADISGTDRSGETMLFANYDDGGVAPEAICADGKGGLFLMADDGLYAWTPGDAAPTPLMERVSRSVGYEAGHMRGAEYQRMFMMDSAPCVLNSYTGALYRWDGQTFARFAQLNWEGMTGQMDGIVMPPDVTRAIYADGALLLLTMDAESFGSPYRLLRADVASGEIAELDLPNVSAIAAYEPGSVLVCTTDYEAMKSELFVYDLGAGRASSPALDVSGAFFGAMAYDAQSKRTYYLSDNAACETSDFQTVRRTVNLPDMLMFAMAGVAVLPGDLIAVADTSGVFVRSMARDTDARQLLAVAQMYDLGLIMGFMEQNPDIELLNAEGLYGEELAQWLQSGDDSVDIYLVTTRTPLDSLYAEGYAADLSASQAIARGVSEMYPVIQQQLTREGRIYALPVHFQLDGMLVDMPLWRQLGLGELPQTYAQYIALVTDWLENKQEQHLDTQLVSIYGGREQFVDAMLTAYALYYAQPDGQISFDAPALREVMQLAERIPLSDPLSDPLFDPLSDPMTNAETYGEFMPFAEYSVYNPQEYFIDDVSLMNGAYEAVVPPVFEAGQTPRLSGYMECYVVNPNSKHLDAAMRFMEYYAAHIDRTLSIQLKPGDNEPIRSAYWEKQIAETERALAELRTQTPGEDGQSAHEQMVQAAESSLEMMRGYTWVVNESAIANYRKMAPYAVFPSFPQWSDLEGEMMDIELRYLEGEITLDQMLAELTNTARTIYLER